MIVEFFTVFKDYLVEVLPFLAIGFFLSGLIYEFVPSGWVEKHIGGRGIKPILYTTIAGTVLPICCIGSLPIAVSLHQKGARLGPVLAFLVATPATSVSALIVCWALLGIKFTVFIFFAVILMGFVMGIIGNFIRYKPVSTSCPQCQQEPESAIDPVCGMTVSNDDLHAEYDGKTYHFCCSHCQTAFEKEPAKYAAAVEYVAGTKERIRSVFRYAYWDMVKEIGPELLLGLVLAALVTTITPVGDFVGTHLDGGLGYPFSLFFGIAIYICSTASVPLVDALVSQGMAIGAGMVLLLVGPVTSWGALLVLRKEFGIKTLAVYLLVISAIALTLGWCFSLL